MRPIGAGAALLPQAFPLPGGRYGQLQAASAVDHRCVDGLVFLIALPAFELIDGAQQSGMLPVWFHAALTGGRASHEQRFAHEPIFDV